MFPLSWWLLDDGTWLCHDLHGLERYQPVGDLLASLLNGQNEWAEVLFPPEQGKVSQ